MALTLLITHCHHLPHNTLEGSYGIFNQNQLHSDDICVSKARNTITNNISSVENGDKFVYVQSGFHTLPERADIAGYLCRIWYASRRNQCDRCHKHHNTMDVDQCEAYRHNLPDVRVLGKGQFSNFYTAR